VGVESGTENLILDPEIEVLEFSQFLVNIGDLSCESFREIGYCAFLGSITEGSRERFLSGA
jgi:hypothetical protein